MPKHPLSPPRIGRPVSPLRPSGSPERRALIADLERKRRLPDPQGPAKKKVAFIDQEGASEVDTTARNAASEKIFARLDAINARLTRIEEMQERILQLLERGRRTE